MAGLETAMEYLRQDAALKLDETETELINKKKNTIGDLIKSQ